MADLAKLRMEIEASGQRTVVDAMGEVDKAIDKTARKTKTATEQMADSHKQVETATGRMAREVETATDRMAKSTSTGTGIMEASWQRLAGAFAAGNLIAKGVDWVIQKIMEIPAAVAGAINSIDSLKISSLQIAAQITNMQGPKNVAEHYDQASKYAGVLATKLQEVDTRSFANAQTLQTMTQAMTTQGVVMDVNNKKQVDSFTSLSNAVAMYTAGQNQSIQAHQETRALLSGEVTQGSLLAKQIDEMAKSTGLYKGGLKEIVAEGKKHGDMLERLAPFLVGINAASGDIEKTWQAVTSSAETAGNMIQRAGFKELYQDAVRLGGEAVSWLKAQAETIGGGISRAWLSVRGVLETISILFNSQDGSLKQITWLVRGILGWVNEILYGWSFLLSTVLPTVAEKFNAIVNIMAAVVNMGYAFGAAMIDSIKAVAQAFAQFGVGMTLALTGDFAGMKREFSKIFGDDFKAQMADNVLVMKGTVIAMKEEWGKLKDTSSFNSRFDSFLGRQQKTDSANTPVLPPGAPPEVKTTDHSAEINSVIAEYNRLQQETIKTDQSTTELWNTLTMLEFQNQKTADSFLAAYNGSAQARSEFDKQGITLAKINALYIQLQENAIIKADNKSYWDNVNANWREGKKEIDEVEKAIKRVFELGKKGDDGPLKQFADDVQASNLAFTKAGDVFDVTAERYLSSIEGAIERLTGISLEKLNQQNADMAADQVGVDVATGQVTDPYAQRTAQMQAYYNKELAAIDKVTESIKAAMETQADLYGENSEEYAAVQKHLLAVTTKRTLTEKQQTIDGNKIEDESFKSRLSMAGQYTGMAGQLFTELANTQDQASRDGFETARAFNLGAAVMSTAAAVMNALATVQPYPLAVAAATMAGITGAIQIAKIASTSFGSSGSVETNIPAGAYGSASSSSGSSTGLNNISKPLASVQDSQTVESLTRLTESTDNVAVTIGRLSKSMESLADLFENGGSGYTLANNAPGRMTELAPLIGSSMMNVAGFGDSMRMFFQGNIAASLQSFNDSVFGGSWRTTGAGLALGIADGVVQALNYVESKKEGGLFGSDSTRIEYSGASDVQEYMSALLQPYVSDITRMAMTLGSSVDISQYSAGYTNIATAGRSSEDIAADIEKWMTTTLQGMSKLVVGLRFSVGAYDDAYTKLKEYNDALVSTNEAFGLIGKEQLLGNIKTAEFISNVQKSLFGGMDEFVDAIDTYFAAMFSDSEQAALKAAQASSQVNIAFAEMGIETIPATRAEFRDLVNSLDVTTESGAKTFAALMDISEAFALVQDHAVDLQTAMDDLLTKSLEYSTDLLTQAMNTAADNLRAALDVAKSATSQLIALRGGNLSPENNYLELKSAFTTAVASNDTDTILRIASQYAAASRAYNASGSNYVSDYNQIEQALAGLTGMEDTSDLSLDALNAHTTYLQSIDDTISGQSDLMNTNNGALAGLNALMAEFIQNQTALQQANQLAYDSRLGTASASLSAINGAGSVASLAGILNQMATGAINNPFNIDSTVVALAQSVAEGSTPQQTLTDVLNTRISNYFTDYIKDGVITGNTTVTSPATNVSDSDRTAQMAAYQAILADWQVQADDLDETLSALGINLNLALVQENNARLLYELKLDEYNNPGPWGINWSGGIDLNEATARYNVAKAATLDWQDQITAATAALETYIATRPVAPTGLDWSMLPGFATGTSYVQHDMPAYIHQGEIIMDRESSDVLRKYGIPSVGRADNHNRELIDEVRALRKELAEQKAYIAKMETHSAASVRVQQAGFQGVIQSSEKQARSLSGIENAAKLEKAA